MTGPGVAEVIGVLLGELRKGHADCLERGVRMLVLGDPHGAMQVMGTMALWARRGTPRRPGEDFYRFEVYTRDEVTGAPTLVSADDLPPAERVFLQMGVAMANREGVTARALWSGYVDGNAERAVALLLTAFAMYQTTGTMWATAEQLRDQP